MKQLKKMTLKESVVLTDNEKNRAFMIVKASVMLRPGSL